MKILIKEIAAKAQVSFSTVSRVINNQGYIKKETKRKVEEAILSLKKEKIFFNVGNNPKISMIAIVVPDVGNTFFGKVIEGIESVCFKNDYIPIIFNSKESTEVEEVILKRLKKIGILGLILDPVTDRKNECVDYQTLIESLNVPIVLLDRELYASNYDGVYVDNFQATMLAIQALINNKHKKIAFIAGPQTSTPGRERYLGFLKSMKQNDIEINKEYLKFGDFKSESGYLLMGELLDSEEIPTAVFVCNNSMSLGAIKCIYERGLKIGKDISLISFDDICATDMFLGNITAVSRPSTKMGEIAMNILLEKIEEENKNDIRKIILKPELIFRGSEKNGI